MSIWRARSIEDVPEVRLFGWRIMETSTGSRHFVGVRPERGTCRVSSVIVKLDVPNRIGITRSGRTYVLEGPPGSWNDEVREYVWSSWCQVNGVADFLDVTDEAMGDGASTAGSTLQ